MNAYVQRADGWWLVMGGQDQMGPFRTKEELKAACFGLMYAGATEWVFRCPRCGSESGNDWSCPASECPMAMHPGRSKQT